jgi:hypothetical protein
MNKHTFWGIWVTHGEYSPLHGKSIGEVHQGAKSESQISDSNITSWVLDQKSRISLRSGIHMLLSSPNSRNSIQFLLSKYLVQIDLLGFLPHKHRALFLSTYASLVNRAGDHFACKIYISSSCIIDASLVSNVSTCLLEIYGVPAPLVHHRSTLCRRSWFQQLSQVERVLYTCVPGGRDPLCGTQIVPCVRPCGRL